MLSLASFYALLAVLALVAADWLLGILAAFRLGMFDVHRLPGQLLTTVLPVVGALLVIWVVQWVANTWASADTAWASAATIFSYFADATVVPKLLADLAAKLSVIGSGVGSTNATPAAPSAGG